MTGPLLITGASGKRGRAFLRHFLESGCDVIAAVLRPQSLDALLADFGTAAREGRLHGVATDLAAEPGVAALLAFLDGSALRPAGLVNNARSLDNLRLGDGGVPGRAGFPGGVRLAV